MRKRGATRINKSKKQIVEACLAYKRSFFQLLCSFLLTLSCFLDPEIKINKYFIPVKREREKSRTVFLEDALLTNHF